MNPSSSGNPETGSGSESEQIYQTVLHNIDEGLILLDKGYRIRMVNQFLLKVLKMTEDEVLGEVCYKLIHRREERCYDCAVAETFQTGRPSRVCHTGIAKDGSITNVELTSFPIFDEEGNVVHVVEKAHEITEKIESAEQLKIFRQFAESSGQGMGMGTLEGDVVYMNPCLYQLLGEKSAEESYKKKFYSYYPEDAQEKLREKIMPTVMLTGQWTGETTLLTVDGAKIPALENIYLIRNDNGAPRYIAMVISDLREQKRAEEERRNIAKRVEQNQKLVSLGRLAGGISHDFNNILQNILGFAALLQDNAAAGSKDAHYLDIIAKSTKRGHDLITQVLTFSRQSRSNKKPILLESVIDETLGMISSTIPRNVVVEKKIGTTELVVNADPSRMGQVIMNLLINAIHAMPDGGTMRVALSTCYSASEDETDDLADDVQFPCAKLSVFDSGTGMDDSAKQQIFDPFFTTKKPGEGTGLGLSVVYGIIKDHGGAISCVTGLHKGTAFHIYLPIIRNEVVTTEEKALIPLRGNERILFVDDEEPIVEMMTESLETLGYDIKAFCDSEKALEEFRNKPESFDLVLTDHMMPGLSGIDLSREIISIRPDIPVLLYTGYDPSIASGSKLPGISAILNKPVEISEVSRAIQEAVNRNR